MLGTDGELSGATFAPPADDSFPTWMEPEAALSAFQPPEGSALLSTVSEAEERRYGFRIGALGFLVKSKAHSEVVREAAICAIPHSPPWLLGLINLRSNLVPVFDLHDLCGLGSIVTPAQPTVLVIDVGENAVGVPIDALPIPLRRLKRILQLPPLPAALSGSVSGSYALDGEVWLELNHEQFFSTVTKTNDLTAGRTAVGSDAIAL